MLAAALLYWVRLHTYSSGLLVKIKHAFSRVILTRRVKKENLYVPDITNTADWNIFHEWNCCTVQPGKK